MMCKVVRRERISDGAFWRVLLLGWSWESGWEERLVISEVRRARGVGRGGDMARSWLHR